jgi:tetratricopeptide (TPR) repeat protein
MTRPIGNVRLKAARQHAGYGSQQALADALTRAARQLGIGNIEISTRQIRRWESAAPPWPRADHQRLLVHVLQLPIDDLGFTAPWEVSVAGPDAAAAARRVQPARPSGQPALPLPRDRGVIQPSTVVSDYAAITAAYRRLYTHVEPTDLHQPVVEHTRMGTRLLGESAGVSRTVLATALAEALLLAGRIEFFDLRQPDDADATFVRALQAAGEADDALLGSAILAHAAFIPGWVGHRDETANRMRAARTYARRGPASAEFLAWLDAVEAECETISGRTREALRLIEHAESVMAAGSQYASPDWFTWFSPARLAAFKGNTQLKAGHLPQAKETLQAALNDPSVAGNRGRSVILGDLAAVEAAMHNPEAACAYAEQALELLGTSWYATGMDRVLEVRKTLQPDAELECVQQLDDLLYGWQATLSTLQR